MDEAAVGVSVQKGQESPGDVAQWAEHLPIVQEAWGWIPGTA